MKGKFLVVLFALCLVALALGALVTGTIVLPLVGQSVVEIYPEAEKLYLPCLAVCDGLLVLFVLGLCVIGRMLYLFALSRTFTPSFVHGLYLLMCFCGIAAVTIEGLYLYLVRMGGGPGPGPALLAHGGILVIITLAVVFALWAHIVNEAMKYKEEVDYTV